MEHATPNKISPRMVAQAAFVGFRRPQFTDQEFATSVGYITGHPGAVQDTLSQKDDKSTISIK